MTTRQNAFAMVLALALAPLPAAAQNAAALQPQNLITADPSRIASEMQKAGYPTELTEDGVGDPMINSSLTGRGRTVNFQVFFYGCTNGSGCTAIQLSAGWTTSGTDIGIVSEWNRTMRFGRAYLDDVNDPIIAMDIALVGGMSSALLAENLAIWKDILPNFAEKVGG